MPLLVRQEDRLPVKNLAHLSLADAVPRNLAVVPLIELEVINADTHLAPAYGSAYTLVYVSIRFGKARNKMARKRTKRDEPSYKVGENELAALNEPAVDFFILADHAEAVNGKLYLMGGAWDRIFVPDFSQPISISFALSILVPWNATNIRHTVQITIEDLDRKRPTGFDLSAGFVTGRPPSVAEGEPQRTILAVQSVPVRFNGQGAYQAVARIVDGHEKRVQFRLVAAPTIQVQPPQGGV